MFEGYKAAVNPEAQSHATREEPSGALPRQPIAMPRLSNGSLPEYEVAVDAAASEGAEGRSLMFTSTAGPSHTQLSESKRKAVYDKLSAISRNEMRVLQVF